MAPSRPLMRGIHPPRVFPKRDGRTSSYDIALTALLVASALLLALIAFGVISLTVSAPTATTGGEAESTDSRPARPRGRRDLNEGLGERGAQWTEVISWEPRTFVYHNFLVSLLTENGNSKDDLRLPTDDNLLSQIQAGFGEGKDIVVTVMSAMGEEQICALKDIGHK